MRSRLLLPTSRSRPRLLTAQGLTTAAIQRRVLSADAVPIEGAARPVITLSVPSLYCARAGPPSKECSLATTHRRGASGLVSGGR